MNIEHLNSVVLGNCVDLINSIPDHSIDLILSDIPYGIGLDGWDVLHENTNSAYLGSSPAQTKAGNVFKRRGKPINGWSEADRLIPIQYYQWCQTWAIEWFRILKPGASALVFAGRRFSHRCICALEDVGFSLKDQIAWTRDRAVHRAQRLSVVFEKRGDYQGAEKWKGWRIGNLRPIFEPIIWMVKPYKIGTTITDNMNTWGVGGYNEDALIKYFGSPDNVIICGYGSKEKGLHEAQKPEKLMRALIEMTTDKGAIVLDPFCGSGTTLVAAIATGRQYIGYEIDDGYYQTARERIEQNTKQLSLF
jgi:site-specific DNA-methyltransferase (adenine-specific)